MTADTITPPIDGLETTRASVNGAAPDRVVLENLPSHRRLTGEQAMARSRLIKRLRYILPGVALFLIAMFFISSQSANEDDAFLEELAVETLNAQEATVIKPSFAGLGTDGQPYEITAATAAQDPDNEDTVNLNGPRAVLQDGEAKTLATANSGTFNSDENLLKLQQNVVLEREISGKSYTLHTPDAVVAIADETVTSSSGVTGWAENGSLRADTMEVYNNERRVIFTGNVRMKIEPGAIKDFSSPTIIDSENTPQTPPQAGTDTP